MTGVEYDKGGVAVGAELLTEKMTFPERFLSPREAAAFERMVRRSFVRNDQGQEGE